MASAALLRKARIRKIENLKGIARVRECRTHACTHTKTRARIHKRNTHGRVGASPVPLSADNARRGLLKLLPSKKP